MGANTAVAGPSLVRRDTEVYLGINVHFDDPESAVFGDSIHLGRRTDIYDAHYNDLSGRGAILGEHFTPLGLPLFEQGPGTPQFTPGSQNITVARNQTVTLHPDDYGKLRVRSRGTVIFNSGVYNFSEWSISLNARLYFAGPVEIRIAGRRATGRNAYVGPAPGTGGLRARDIVLYINGQNGHRGRLRSQPKAAKFGINNTVIANVFAPRGTLWFRRGTDATGAFLGRWVVVGIGAEVRLDSGF